MATVEVALVGYTLLILFRNFLEGLRGVLPGRARGGARHGAHPAADALARRAAARRARDHGGLRVAVVSTIALATVAALVIPEGLGYPIFLALREAFKTEIIVAGGACRRPRPRRRRTARARGARTDAVGAGEESHVTLADLGVFADALEFVVDERRSDPREDLGAPAALRRRAWRLRSRSRCRSASGSGISTAARSSRSTSRTSAGRCPSLAVIAIGIAFLGVGFTNVAVALVVLAVPPILTNAYVAVDGVESDVVEAARGMGMTKGQIVRRVELPLAVPLVFAGIRTAAVFVIATATIAAVAGGGGLGDIIVNQAAYGLEGVVGAAICVSLLALAADAALGLVQRLRDAAGTARAGSRALEPDVVTGVTRR